jgi:hypothetical protein
MLRCETPSASVYRRSTHSESGAAIIVALVVIMLLSVMGLGLVLTTSLEPAIASSYATSTGALYAAEAGLAIAAHELAACPDWNLLLAGQVRSSWLEVPSSGRLERPDGTLADLAALTNLANCGHPEPCTDVELDAFTADRPWGPNNPRWQLLGLGRVDRLLPGGSALPPFAVVVWVADDPADTDGNPIRDTVWTPGGPSPAGAGLVQVRAEAFGSRSSHRVVMATLARPRDRAGSGVRLVAWREER